MYNRLLMNTIGGEFPTLLNADDAAREAERLRLEVESLRARLLTVGEISFRVTETLDLETVLQQVIDGARLLTNAHYGTLTIYDGSLNLERFIISGIPDESLEHVETWFRDPKSLEYLHKISEPTRFGNVASYLASVGFPNPPVSVSTFLGTPIRHLGRCIGGIFLAEKEGGQEFTSEDDESLVWLASHATAAITNALRYTSEHQAKASLQVLVEASPMGVAVLDPKTMSYTLVNEERRRITRRISESGRTLESIHKVLILRRPDGSVLPPDDIPALRALATGETIRAEEATIEFPDGQTTNVISNATPIFSEDGEVTAVVSTLQDMTPIEEMQRQRSEFLGMVGHELRTPLTTIKGATATALDSSTTLSDAEMVQFFRIIDEQASHMRRLINDLLDLTRIDAGTLSISPEPTDMAMLVEQARSALLRSGARNSVDIELPLDLPRVSADRERILQVLNNLLINASRYSPERSSIDVSAWVEDVYVSVSISDEGRGISAERLPHLFKKFSRLDDEVQDRRGEGNGLGLAICKGIVEAHGGRIWAESDGDGFGTRVTFTIPTVNEAVNDRPAAAGSVGLYDDPVRASPRANARILAVDDDPQILRHIRSTLSKAGYTPIVTVDPSEATQLVSRERPHLVLLDMMMPGINGIELMERILKIADVPVIFVSGYDGDRNIGTALNAGADDYIVKPFSPNELIARIESVLRRQTASERVRSRGSYLLGDLRIDYAERRVTVAGEQVQLTPTEYKLLHELSTNAGRVLTHDQILRRVWGPNYFGDSRLVRSFVRKLRRKLKDNANNPKYVITEPRVGYRMQNSESPSRRLG